MVEFIERHIDTLLFVVCVVVVLYACRLIDKVDYDKKEKL